MKRGLIIIAVAGVLLLITLAVSIAVIATAKYGELGDEICYTTGCIRAASKIFENMNPEVKPCENFYKFACGGFEESTTIPNDKTHVSTFSVIKDKLEKQLKKSMEEPSSPNEPRPFRLVKKLYKNCMNISAIEKAGLEPLHRILRQLGKWPVLEGDHWKGDGFNWTESVYKCRELGYANYFIDFSIGVDLKNSTKRVIEMDHTSFGLARQYLSRGVEDPIVKAYFQYMVDTAVILGADKRRAMRELIESLKFEIKLTNISLPEEDRRDVTLLYNLMSISELNKRYPSVAWKEYINRLLSPVARVDAEEIVLVLEPRYISSLERLVRNTPKRVQANYVMWRVILESISYLSQDVRNKQLVYYTAVSGEKERKPRWKECVDIVSEKLRIGTSALYVRNYFKESAKTKAVEITADIKNELIKILEQTEWMDENTKGTAMKKASSIFSHIAYPDELLDNEKLEGFYAELEFRPDDFIGNMLNLTRVATEYSFNELKNPVNKSYWISHSQSAVVNAFYDFFGNSLQLPAGILQGTVFNSDRPQYMNYGSIGFVIGHELTHGFDNNGRQYDQYGNLQNWWARETEEKYLEKAKCIIYQYGNYTVDSVGLKLNGINTLGENIADNGGIKEAYLAYKEYVKRNGPEPKLPGLDYTPNQLFWISAGNTWCTKYRPEVLKNDILTDVHSPGKFRVLGPFSNRPEFAADFECPVGSPMNPKIKCSVW